MVERGKKICFKKKDDLYIVTLFPYTQPIMLGFIENLNHLKKEEGSSPKEKTIRCYGCTNNDELYRVLSIKKNYLSSTRLRPASSSYVLWNLAWPFICRHFERGGNGKGGKKPGLLITMGMYGYAM